MPEHDNDKLEDFFRKVAGRPDISFQEEDWKKLEARLDARGTRLSIVKKTRIKIAGAVLAALLISYVYWLEKDFEKQPDVQKNNAGEMLRKNPEVSDDGLHYSNPGAAPENNDKRKIQKRIPAPIARVHAEVPDIISQKPIQQPLPVDEGLTTELLLQNDYTAEQTLIEERASEAQKTRNQNLKVDEIETDQPGNDKFIKELIPISPAIADKTKQNANVELPGAGEVVRSEADAIVKEQKASDQEKQLASPRLSVLLSFAPDFSSTSFNQYTSPGDAFGIMIHYHVKKSWSFSTGIVKTNKKYTGDGEDYNPPKGYWKYYTNGIVPQTVDGSCSILEIPIMLQYTVAEVGRSKFLLGAGASSYIMLNESYQYNFGQPNPGAKEGWDSGKNSSFLFNMINFTIAFEHQILPGLRIGIEPYIKIPIEEIGWSNLKLYSTGASLTLRYIILKKEYSSLPTRSRSPD